MERFQFLDLYIDLSRIFAVLIAIVGLIQAFRFWDAGFWAFVLTALTALVWAFLVLVGADVLACFRAIEQNTRKGGS